MAINIGFEPRRFIRRKGKFGESPGCDAFISDVLYVYEKHGLSIGHEDGQGSFLIEKLSERNVDWIKSASDNT